MWSSPHTNIHNTTMLARLTSRLGRPASGALGARRRFASSTGAAAGQLYICGTGESNKLGLGDTRDRETPTLVEALADQPITCTCTAASTTRRA